MSTDLREKSLKENAWKVCKDFLGGSWRTVTLEEFKLFEVRGGLSSALYRCALPSNVSTNPGEPKEVLMRMYGPMQENADKVIAEAVAFMLLSEKKLGPKLYGVFPKGRLEEFIPSRSLRSEELSYFSPLIAREVAKLHALDVPVKKVPEMLTGYPLKWLDEIQEILKNDKENNFMSLDEFKREIKWMTKEIERMKPIVVYCHNDLQGGNILCREDSTQDGKPKLTLIDFEFGAYNYRRDIPVLSVVSYKGEQLLKSQMLQRGYDIASHFSFWCFDYVDDEYPHIEYDQSKFPTEKEQREWVTVYLDQLTKEGVRTKMTVEEEVNQVLSEIPLFVCATHLLGSLWSVKMLLTSSEGSVYKEYGNISKNLYLKLKEEYLATTSNGANDNS